MKPVILILFLFCAGHAALSQKLSSDYTVVDYALIECVYKVSFKESKQIDEVKTEIMKLFIGENGISKFASNRRFLAEDLVNTYTGELASSQLLVNEAVKLPKSVFKYIVYKDMGEKTLTFEERTGGHNYRYRENLDMLMEWKILPGKETVNGYECQMATTFFAGRHYKAWFTMELPVPEGPYKFSGLPGLIVKVYDKQKDYVFELQHLKNLAPKVPILKRSDKVNITDLEKGEYNEVVKRHKKNFMQSFTNAGMDLPHISEEQKKNYQRRLQLKDNPIELF